MGNYQRLLDEEMFSFEVIGFAENLQGMGPQVRELGCLEQRQAYATAGDFICDRMKTDGGVTSGDVLLYDYHKDRWATLSFVVAESVHITPVTDTM